MGTRVGSLVGLNEGGADGNLVGAREGEAVGFLVGARVGALVGGGALKGEPRVRTKQSYDELTTNLKAISVLSASKTTSARRILVQWNICIKLK